MSLFGWSIIAVMATIFLPWTYVFDALGRGDYRKPLSTVMAISTIIAATLVFALLLFAYASDQKSIPMNIFLLASMHVLSFALGAIIWAIVGQRVLRGFLIRPQPFLLITLGLSLCAAALGLTFSPSDF